MRTHYATYSEQYRWFSDTSNTRNCTMLRLYGVVRAPFRKCRMVHNHRLIVFISTIISILINLITQLV